MGCMFIISHPGSKLCKLCIRLLKLTKCVKFTTSVRKVHLISARSDKTSATAIYRLEECFLYFRDLFAWMILLGGDEFKECMKSTQFTLTAMPSSSTQYRLGNYGSTSQIIEFHFVGRSLLMVDLHEVSTDNSDLRVHWEDIGLLSRDRVEAWEDSLHELILGFRYAISSPRRSHVRLTIIKHVRRDPKLSELSLWYFQFCTGACLHAQLAERLHVCINEALDACRQELVAGPLATYKVDLALLLFDFSRKLGDAGKTEGAILLDQRATSFSNSFATLIPDSYTIDLARSLYKLSDVLRELSKNKEADAIQNKAIEAHRKLETWGPDTFTAEIANLLHDASVNLSKIGKRVDAIKVFEEVLWIRRELVAKEPDVFNADLAESLHHFSLCLKALGKKVEARSAIEEAVQIRRKLAAEDPDRYNAGLVASQDFLYHCLYDTGRKSEATKVTKQARFSWATPEGYHVV